MSFNPLVSFQTTGWCGRAWQGDTGVQASWHVVLHGCICASYTHGVVISPQKKQTQRLCFLRFGTHEAAEIRERALWSTPTYVFVWHQLLASKTLIISHGRWWARAVEVKETLSQVFRSTWHVDHHGNPSIHPISTSLSDPCILTVPLLCISADTRIPLHLTRNGIKKSFSHRA